MEFIEVEYNEELKPLEKLLSGVKRAGDFFVSGTLELPMPKVEVDGVGVLSFPVPDEQIAAIVQRAERAPYGKGQETILDTSVRKVWQLASSKVRVSGKSWGANFESILAKVAAGLGCERVTVSAELYKLLVYDREGFFLSHRDTEKTEGMFGTLVISLPSRHRGGELRIRHAGREITIDTSTTDFAEISYVAFYADCEHEARPVREGNRVCLVYNLIQKRGKSRVKTLTAPEYESETTEAAAILKGFFKSKDAPAKIGWLFEHQYSPAGLSFAALKGSDAAKAGVLLRAAERSQCAAHLAIVHIGDSGGAEPDYGDYYGYRSRRDRYRDWDDGDEDVDGEDYDDGEADDEGEDGGDFTVISVDDSWQYVDEWRDIADRPAEFGPIPLGDGELLPTGALDGEKPDKQRMTEASGNEGASYERSYHRAALVLWPLSGYADVLFQAGVVATLPYLKQLIAGSRQEAVALARRVVDAWAGEPDVWHRYPVRGPEASHRVEMLGLLTRLGDTRLLKRFIEESVTPRYDGSENATLVSAASALQDSAAAAFSTLLSARLPDRPCECTEFLIALNKIPSLRFPEVADAALESIERIGKANPRLNDNDWEPQERRRSLDGQFVVNLLVALEGFNAGQLREAAAEKLAARPGTFNPVTVITPALSQLHEERGRKLTKVDQAFFRLWAGSAEFLLERSEFPPEPPSDWRQEVKVSCSCVDCRDLQAFALDPVERVHRFRINKDRRQHLHRTIDQYGLDMTHVTERKGSPQTLVCTKDRRSFDRRRKQYAKEIAAMRTLVGLSPGTGAATSLSSRMQGAAARSREEKHGS